MGNPAAGLDDEPTTTTTAPSAQSAGTGGVTDQSRPDYGNPSAGNPTATSMTSAWGQQWMNVDAIRRHYYATNDELGYEPVQSRLMSWRSNFAQTGQADLGQILDKSLAWDKASGPSQDPIAETHGRMQDRKTVDPQWKPVAAWLEYMRTADKATVTRIQKDLYDAGYMNEQVYKHPKALREGYYDLYTQEAFSKLLSDGAMSNDVPLSELLRQRKDEIKKNGGDPLGWLRETGQVEAPPPFMAEVENPDDINAAARDQAVQLTGRRYVDGITDGGLVGGIQGQQVAQQRAEYDNRYNDKGGTVTNAPSSSAYAESQLLQNHGDMVGAHAYLGAFNTLLQSVGLGG